MLRTSAICASVTGWPSLFCDHHRQRLGAEAGEDLVELLLRLAHRVVGREVLLADAAERERPERDDQQDHHDDDGHGKCGGPLHHPVDQLAPEALLDLCAGLGLLGLLGQVGDDRVGQLPVTKERNPQQGPHSERVDIVAQDAQRCGQHRDRQDRRKHDRGDDRVGDGLQEPLREQQQRHRRCHQDHRGEHDRAARGHHRSSDRGLGVVALGDLLTEPADHEQAVVDRDAEPHQGHHRLGEEVHGHEFGEQPHDAQRACDGQAADDPREGGGDDATEHEEQHHADQRDGGNLGTLLVFADGAGQFGGQRLKAGQFHVDAVVADLEQVVLDQLVVVQDRVVVVALELDRHERVLFVRVGHFRQCVGALEIADRAQDLVGVVLLDLGEVVQDLLREVGVVDGLAVWGGVDPDDVAGRVAAVGLVRDNRGVHRLAALVVEAALGDMAAEADAEHAATKAQCDHDADHYVSVSVHRSTPPGEHLSS